jgi:hypothetical protein
MQKFTPPLLLQARAIARDFWPRRGAIGLCKMTEMPEKFFSA